MHLRRQPVCPRQHNISACVERVRAIFAQAERLRQFESIVQLLFGLFEIAKGIRNQTQADERIGLALLVPMA